MSISKSAKPADRLHLDIWRLQAAKRSFGIHEISDTLPGGFDTLRARGGSLQTGASSDLPSEPAGRTPDGPSP